MSYAPALSPTLEDEKLPIRWGRGCPEPLGVA